MKLPLATGCLSASGFPGVGMSSPNGRFVFRVDRRFDRLRQPPFPMENLPGDRYLEAAPTDRWDVVIDQGAILLRELTPEGSVGRRFEGQESVGTSSSKIRLRMDPVLDDRRERRFDLGTGALGETGRFVIWGDEAELTIYGSGAPILLSERGRLVLRPRSF